MRLRLAAAAALGLAAPGLWLWAMGPGTTLPGAVVAWILAAGGFMLGWRLTRRPSDLPEDPGPPTASTHPYGVNGEGVPKRRHGPSGRREHEHGPSGRRGGRR